MLNRDELILDNQIKIDGVVNKLKLDIESLKYDLEQTLKTIETYKNGKCDLSTINSLGIVQGQGFNIDVSCARLGELLIMKKNLK